MKNLIFFVLLVLLSSCSTETEEIVPSGESISWRTLSTYLLSYQNWSTSDVLTQNSSDLDTWSSGYVASSTTAPYGTSSTMYLAWNPTLSAYENRPLTIFQVGSGDLKWVEMNDACTGWTSPASIGEETTLLPSVENVDGVVIEAHVADETASPVKGSIKSGSSWGAPYYLYRTILTAPGYASIVSNYSPTVEFHSSAAVEYLTTAEVVSGSPSYGAPKIYWRYTATNYTQTSAPSITLGVTSGELNASFTPVAVNDNGDDKLYVFYTDPGTSTASENTIRYVIGSVTGSTDGTITSWSSSQTVSTSALTTNKIDGIFTDDTEIIAITYRSASSGKIDVAYSDDFGSNWTLVQDIASNMGAPSICNQE